MSFLLVCGCFVNEFSICVSGYFVSTLPTDEKNLPCKNSLY